ncbi:MAG TPA: type II toxin-antitoxin system HicB family antitoxin [Candidatus Tyrphobacter sp.]
MNYVAILEHNADGWSAYVLDLPGCTSWGETREAVIRNIRDAIESHIGVLRERGETVPEANAVPEIVTIAG